jgi:hypothetical protein
MNETKIKWFSMNLHQRVEEHEPVDLKQATEITNQYIGHGGEKFKTDNEALAATMFGFSKSKSEFIEICIDGLQQISYRFEFSDPNASWFQKLRGRGTFQREEELHTPEQLIAKVTQFYTHSSQQMVEGYKGKPRHQARSPLGNLPDASIGARIFGIVLFSILGLFFAYTTMKGMVEGKIWWSHRHAPSIWIYKDQRPEVFWIVTVIYAGISTWMIRGSVLELKLVRKMMKGRGKRKVRATEN